VRECAEAFSRPGALQRVVDYPLGQVTGRQALAVRTTDSAIHTWDLAQAIGVDDTLDIGLVAWISNELDEIYAGRPEGKHLAVLRQSPLGERKDGVQERVQIRLGLIRAGIAPTTPCRTEARTSPQPPANASMPPGALSFIY
jgi:hypothetical protein